MHDMLIITGDMNAKVGNDKESYEIVIGIHGMGQRWVNDNGKRLFGICTNLLSQENHSLIKIYTRQHAWISPGKNNQIDHTLINKRFIN